MNNGHLPGSGRLLEPDQGLFNDIIWHYNYFSSIPRFLDLEFQIPIVCTSSLAGSIQVLSHIPDPRLAVGMNAVAEGNRRD